MTSGIKTNAAIPPIIGSIMDITLKPQLPGIGAPCSWLLLALSNELNQIGLRGGVRGALHFHSQESRTVRNCRHQTKSENYHGGLLRRSESFQRSRLTIGFALSAGSCHFLGCRGLGHRSVRPCIRPCLRSAVGRTTHFPTRLVLIGKFPPQSYARSSTEAINKFKTALFCRIAHRTPAGEISDKTPKPY